MDNGRKSGLSSGMTDRYNKKDICHLIGRE